MRIFRKPKSGEVIAQGGMQIADGILRRCGFHEMRLPEQYRWWRLPKGLGRPEEKTRATRAAVVLRAAGFLIDLDPALYDRETERRLQELLDQEPWPAASPENREKSAFSGRGEQAVDARLGFRH
ncbi:hypothetical protein [Streptomyces sp. NPDC127098]|uniref:hypothetical protein n=1 Tax=Streptomyces sp. NPDC127098 TaxID=3347137 RepID=UPI0036472003